MFAGYLHVHVLSHECQWVLVNVSYSFVLVSPIRWLHAAGPAAAGAGKGGRSGTQRFAGAQGTGMALEDAHALAAAIGEHGATEAALRAYEAARVPRISHISNVVMVRPTAALGLCELRSASL